MAGCPKAEPGMFCAEDTGRLDGKVLADDCDVEKMQATSTKFSEGGSEVLKRSVGERILDILIEMKKTKEKKETFCWELQLLNVGCQETLHENNVAIVTNASVRKCSHTTVKKKTQVEVGMRQLLKAARQSWARLMTQGVQSLLACPQAVQMQGVRTETWSCVSPSDILLLIEVKYDVVTHLLFDDMLREHHGAHVWKTLRPWQRHNETLWLEELVEDALASDDMIALADLPGAFLIYRNECFTAVSLLYKLNTCRQQEKEALSALVERLDKKNLRLICLYIQSATLRAQRETTVYNAFMAVWQSWDTWPHVRSPCREEFAVALLSSDEDAQEQVMELNSLSAQQTLLQLLLLTQQQERKQLVHLLRGVTLEEVQTLTTAHASKTSCIKKLQQICENQAQHSTIGPPINWSQDQLERAASALVVHLLEIHDRETSSVLPALLDENEHLHTLRQEYQSKFQTQKLNINLIQVLDPDGPSTNSNSDLSSKEQVAHQTSCSGSVLVQKSAAGLCDSSTSAPLEVVQTGDLPDKQGVCAGCGVTLGGVPYLEILCAPDEMTKADGEVEKQDSETKQLNSEEQDSLIALAWSTQLEAKTGHQGVETAHVVNVHMQPSEGGIVEHTGRESKGEPEKANVLHAAQQALVDSVDMKTSDKDRDMVKDLGPPAQPTVHSSVSKREAGMECVRAREPLSAIEREKTMRKLVDVHRRVERRQRWDRERQQLRVQERLSIIQSRKADEDIFGPKHRDRIRRISREREENKNQQKTLVREQLEQLRRERSFIMQSRRNRNTAGFRELLIPVNLRSGRTEEDQENGSQ
ncbi:uncharacterized protein LOC130915874 [Corythoichthys intestinalis]|uniref:uncharacterized protein LOC130915874 n=1 Tax=Corythoichthys intestinalis TaxID=161448 RepID=UPI0025A529FA|nr:uncharacterized protein LOC130915874 [Corythoichthys intestinalis]